MPPTRNTHMEEASGSTPTRSPARGSAPASCRALLGLVFPVETDEFRLKMIRGGLQGGRKTGFLWSISPTARTPGSGRRR